MARKRAVLEACVGALLESEGARRDEYERYVARHPELTRYAEFRAADDQATGRWRSWPASPGRLPAAALDPAAINYHCYVQFAIDSQLGTASSVGAGLYLDLPVGVHPDGYDTWAHDDVFAEAEVGAPPDDFFAAGQKWGFPPLHPERIRESGYRYLIQAYRSALSFARAIRIDHVLGLNRMFWVPPGGSASDGVYVRYRQDELHAVIAIEAARAGAVVIGEDLGTVTSAIRQAMDRDGMLHSFVTRFEATAKDPMPQPRQPCAASLGSHDLPKFAAYWSKEGPLSEDDPRAGMDEQEALEQSLYSLAAGPANVVFADLGELIGERVPDNQPGTGPEAGNWQHRIPRRLDELAADPAVTQVLAGIRDRRTAVAQQAVAATEGETR
jgi:4-alpha-glucanotransferase